MPKRRCVVNTPCVLLGLRFSVLCHSITACFHIWCANFPFFILLFLKILLYIFFFYVDFKSCGKLQIKSLVAIFVGLIPDLTWKIQSAPPHPHCYPQFYYLSFQLPAVNHGLEKKSSEKFQKYRVHKSYRGCHGEQRDDSSHCLLLLHPTGPSLCPRTPLCRAHAGGSLRSPLGCHTDSTLREKERPHSQNFHYSIL